MQPAAAQIQFDPFSRESWLDPYPIYRLLRRECPVYQGTSASRPFFALSRYADLLEYGRDWETFSYRGGVDIDGSGQQIAAGNFLEVDPPEHGPLRKVVHQIFTPKAIRARLENHLEESVSRIVAELRASRGGDLAAQLAWPVSIGTAGALLGFPPEDHGYLRDLSLAFMRRELGSDQVPAAAVDASQAFREYFGSLIDARRTDPAADILGHLATARLDEVQLPHEQAVGIAVLLYIGALDTTACLITNAFVHLAAHQDQRAWLARNPEAILRAVEEVLRFDSPQLQFKRTAACDVEIHGVEIPAGSAVIFLYGSANRDEKRFPDAANFEIRRDPQRHLAFGDGIHHCLGAPMARLEAVATVRGVLSELPEYSLLDGAVRLQNHSTRGYVELPFAA